MPSAGTGAGAGTAWQDATAAATTRRRPHTLSPSLSLLHLSGFVGGETRRRVYRGATVMGDGDGDGDGEQRLVVMMMMLVLMLVLVLMMMMMDDDWVMDDDWR